MSELSLALYRDRFVRRLHGSLVAKAADFDTDRIGPGGAMALLTIADLQEASMQEIATRLCRDKSQITRQIRVLEDKGIVHRETSEDDARSTRVSLTPKGTRMVETHRQAVEETIDEILSPISDDEKAILAQLLQRVVP